MNHVHNIAKPQLRLRRMPRVETTSKIGISTIEGIHIIQPRDIIYCQAQGNYSLIHTRDRCIIMCSKPLKAIENALPEAEFIRAHQSYVVNINEIRIIGESLDMSDKSTLPISRARRQSIKQRLMSSLTLV